MNKEFNLSKKIKTDIIVCQDTGGLIEVDDVKEFIRILKEQYKQFGDIQDFINQLAGDKLI